MPVEFTSFIARYRDLIETSGPERTINLHREKIAEHGFTHWGWWKKGNETLPISSFFEINKMAQSDGIWVYLFDSGTGKIYPSKLKSIDFATNGSQIPSPSPEATPSYYNTSLYFAWFKLEEIGEAVPFEDLHGWSYVRVDELFHDNTSRFTPFYEKQVRSINELRSQDRTIWFIRPFRAGDGVHEVSLIDAAVVAPSDFPTGYQVHAGRRIAWMSDLHFSEGGHHSFPLTSDHSQVPLWLATEKSLADSAEAKSVAGLICSGDFTWTGSEVEYGNVGDSISELKTKLSLRDYDLLFCPGNHDIVFSDTPEESGSEIIHAKEEATKGYRHFYTRFFSKEPNEYLSCGRKFLLGGVQPVEVASLNSNLLQQVPGAFQGHGFVGQEQLEFTAKSMNWEKKVDDHFPLRIVVLHHHVLPVSFLEQPRMGGMYSVTLDAEAILRWAVRYRVQFILHGHMHQPFYTSVRRPINAQQPGDGDFELHILGIGSAGVSTNHVGEVGHNTLGILDISPGIIEFTVRTLHPTNPSQQLFRKEFGFAR